MKLSFSTKGWSERSWDELVGLAEEMDFNGIEVFDVAKNEELVGKGSPFHIYNTHATARELREKGLIKNAGMVERCGLPGEKVYYNLEEIDPASSYFSVILVKEKEFDK